MTGLSPDEIDRVRDSFDRLWPTSAQTAGLFYERLFEIAPEVRPLFRHDIDEQKRKFIATLAVIVGSLDDRSKLIALTDGLARQHGSFESGRRTIRWSARLCCGVCARARRRVDAGRCRVVAQGLRHHFDLHDRARTAPLAGSAAVLVSPTAG